MKQDFFPKKIWLWTKIGSIYSHPSALRDSLPACFRVLSRYLQWTWPLSSRSAFPSRLESHRMFCTPTGTLRDPCNIRSSPPIFFQLVDLVIFYQTSLICFCFWFHNRSNFQKFKVSHYLCFFFRITESNPVAVRYRKKRIWIVTVGGAWPGRWSSEDDNGNWWWIFIIYFIFLNSTLTF